MLSDNDKRAERALLGLMLRHNPAIADVAQIVRPETFGVYAHQLIFSAMLALWDKAKPVDMVTVADVLKAAKEVEDAGGYGYLAELWEAAPTGANAEFYGKLVRDASLLRNLARAAQEIATEAANPTGPAEEVLEAAEKRIFEIADVGTLGQTIELASALRQSCDRYDERVTGGKAGACQGIPTGWMGLDNIMSGLQDGEFIVIGARPSFGKTAMALGILRYAAVEAGLPVFFASLEQGRVEIADRLLCCQGGIDSHRLRRGVLDERELKELAAANSALSACRFHVDDSPQQSVMRIAANARRLKLRHGIKLVVVDYLQLVQPDNRKETREQQVSGISRRLKLLARELAIPVVCLAQLNRGVEGRPNCRPRLSDLRDSGAVEQDADVVLLLHRPEETAASKDGKAPTRYAQTNELVEVLVEKQRNGPVGFAPLRYAKPFMWFEDYVPEVPS